jgi:hypothetical protein
MSTSLPITNIINISATFLPAGISNFNVNNLALITSDQFLSNANGDLYRSYVSLQQVGTDFGTSTETYQQAAAVFAQTPNLVGAGGNLLIFPAFANSALNAISVNAGGANYKAGDIVTVTQTGASGGTATVTVNGSGTVSAITLITGGVGYSTTTSAATTGGAGSGLTVTISTVATETLAQAIARAQSYVYFVGAISTSYGANTTWAALANTVQGYQTIVLFLPSNAISDIQGVFTTIQQASDYNTRCLFYSNSSSLQARLFAAAYASRLLSVNVNGSRTAVNMNLQQLQTITADTGITQNLVSLCNVAGVDIYPSTAGYPGVYSNGANKYADEVWNLIAFVAYLEVAGFNYLAGVGTKVAQTETGVSGLKNAYKLICQQFVNNGYIAPGAWTSAQIIGVQADLISNIAQYGYYLYSQPVNQQTTAARAARQAPVISIAIKEAGAINSSIVQVYINA